jgi:membrane protease YdiL (CAAX protease family)
VAGQRPERTLPVTPTPYHHFFRAPTYRWWRSLLALILGAVVFGLVNLAVALPVVLWEVATGARSATDLEAGLFPVTPAVFAANNVALGFTIGVSVLVALMCFGQRPRWLSSVTGGLRWGFLARCVAVCLVPYSVLTAYDFATGAAADFTWQPHTVFMIATILLTTPFQAAGEEYGLRGLYYRAVAAWIPNPVVGALVGGAASSVVFMLLHGAGDLWLNTFYFVFGAVACRLTSRTGGLEAAIALHVVNNMVSEISMPFTDISGIFDRQAGTATFGMLLPQLGVIAVAWGLLEGLAHVTKVSRVGPPTAASGSAPEA